VFELTVPTQAPLVPGEFRLAGPADLPIAETWYRAFKAEADPSVDEPRAAELGARALRAGRVFLWDHNGPVTQAAIIRLERVLLADGKEMRLYGR
jgi:hypothetical protein